MALIEFVLRLLALNDFSGAKQIEYVTKNYFSEESLLFVYWSNASVEFRPNDFWMNSEIGTIETCNCDYVTDAIIWGQSYVQNIVVMFGDMVPERRHIESMRQCLSWNARSKILAVVDDSHDIVNVTLNKIWTYTKAINVTVMVYTSTSVRYYTLYPYDNFKVVELDQNGLFPPKPMNNLHGSVISVASMWSEPYVLTSDIPDEYTEGLEMRIINTMCKKFNFKIEFVKPPNQENPWITISKGKVAGNFGLLYRCEADIAFHGVQVRGDRCAFADVTTVHTIDSVVWVVPTRPYSFNWKSIFILFKIELWALLLATLILIAVTLYLITKYEFGSLKTSYNFLDVFFQIFGIHLGAAIRFYRSGQLYRLFIFLISCYTIIIIASYQSSLITHLTTPGSEDQYDIIEEALDDGLIGYFFLSSKGMLNKTDHDLWNKILQPGMYDFEEDSHVLLRFVALDKMAYTLLNKNFINFLINKYYMDDDHEPMARTLRDVIYNYMVAMFTSKGHPLRDVISNELLRLNEAGILEHWMEEISMENSGVYEDDECTDEDVGPKTLSVEHLKGAFYMIALMLSISGVVFMGEMVYYWWNIKKFSVGKIKLANKSNFDENLTKI